MQWDAVKSSAVPTAMVLIETCNAQYVVMRTDEVGGDGRAHISWTDESDFH